MTEIEDTSELIKLNYQLASRNVVLKTIAQEMLDYLQCRPTVDGELLADRIRAAITGEPLPH
jgi:hypothetical protein